MTGFFGPSRKKTLGFAMSALLCGFGIEGTPQNVWPRLSSLGLNKSELMAVDLRCRKLVIRSTYVWDVLPFFLKTDTARAIAGLFGLSKIRPRTL
jgi:hypothetical protein